MIPPRSVGLPLAVTVKVRFLDRRRLRHLLIHTARTWTDTYGTYLDVSAVQETRGGLLKPLRGR
jgi:hypothetical protein